MSTRNAPEQTSFAVVPVRMKCFFAAVFACVLALVVSFALMLGSSGQAYASIYPVDEPSQTEAEATGEKASVVIEDDAVPMASGAKNSMVEQSMAEQSVAEQSASVPVYWAVVGGIVVVAAFFLVSLRKMNANIKEMDSVIQ